MIWICDQSWKPPWFLFFLLVKNCSFSLVVNIIQLKYRWISPDHGCPRTKTLKVRSKHGKHRIYIEIGEVDGAPHSGDKVHVSQVVRSFATGVDSL